MNIYAILAQINTIFPQDPYVNATDPFTTSTEHLENFILKNDKRFFF